MQPEWRIGRFDMNNRDRVFIEFDGGEIIDLSPHDAAWMLQGHITTREHIAQAAWRRVLARGMDADPWAGYRTMWTAMAGQ
jgi:hypothetical protein